MDKEEPVKDTAEDVTRESLIEISYRVPEADPNAEKSPKDVEHEKVIAPIVCDGDEKTRSKLISISYSPSPDVKGLPLLPGQVDGVESCTEKSRTKSFEEQEEAAIARVRKELMRNIPFLLIIDNLESEKDWWDHKLVMDLLPRLGGETHVIISTRLSGVMNLEPLKLSYLSEVEAMSLMLGSITDQSVTEALTLGLAIVGAILSELPISPSRLLDTVNRMLLRDATWSGRENSSLRRNNFLLQLFEEMFELSRKLITPSKGRTQDFI